MGRKIARKRLTIDLIDTLKQLLLEASSLYDSGYRSVKVTTLETDRLCAIHTEAYAMHEVFTADPFVIATADDLELVSLWEEELSLIARNRIGGQ